MQLGSFSAATKEYARIRELTREEIETDTRFKKLVTEARNRLALFRMLDRNYADWRIPLSGLSGNHRPESMSKAVLPACLFLQYTIDYVFNQATRKAADLTGQKNSVLSSLPFPRSHAST